MGDGVPRLPSHQCWLVVLQQECAEGAMFKLKLHLQDVDPFETMRRKLPSVCWIHVPSEVGELPGEFYLMLTQRYGPKTALYEGTCEDVSLVETGRP